MIKILLIILFLNFYFIINFSNLLKKIIIQNICFLISFIILFFYNFNRIKWITINLFIGLDFFNFILVVLVFWIIGLIFLRLDNNIIFILECIIYFIILLIIMLLRFICLNFLIFYILFEISLIPTFFLIIKWGLRDGRVVARFYLLFYTLFFSIPLMIFLFIIYLNLNTISFILLRIKYVEINLLIYYIIILSFLVKIPIFMIHSWLLKAHVEAPVFGSILLAALLLKLGGYGLLRFNYLIYISMRYEFYLIILRLIGRLILRLVCLINIDIKIIVAYSSVVHMGIILVGLLINRKLGFISAYIIIVSHGLCSSGLFYIINIYYFRTNRRLLLFNKGLINYIPRLRKYFFLLLTSNISAPFSLNLVGEILLLMIIFRWRKIVMFFIALICIFRFIYSLYLYSYSQHGVNYILKNILFNSGKINEYINLIIHWLPLNLIIFNLFIFIE